MLDCVQVTPKFVDRYGPFSVAANIVLPTKRRKFTDHPSTTAPNQFADHAGENDPSENDVTPTWAAGRIDSVS